MEIIRISSAPVETMVLFILHVSQADGGKTCLGSRAGIRVKMAVPRLSPRNDVLEKGSGLLTLSGVGADQKVR